MDQQQEVSLLDHSVRLPSDGWVDLPGSPFQVMARGEDVLGVMYVRLHPDLTWSQWESFKQEVDRRNSELMKQHPLAHFWGLNK